MIPGRRHASVTGTPPVRARPRAWCVVPCSLAVTALVVMVSVRDTPARVGAGHEDQGVLATLLRGLEHRETLLRSARCFFTLKLFVSPEQRKEVIAAGNASRLPKRGPQLTKYFWATDGLRWRCDEKAAHPGGRVWCERYSQAAFDGQSYYWLDLASAHGSKGPQRVGGEFTEHLLYFMMDFEGQPLSEFLAQPDVSLVGREDVRGEPAYRLAYEEDGERGPRTLTWWLVPQRGFAAGKFEYRLIWPKARIADSPETGLCTILLAEEWGAFAEGLWLPTVVKKESYALIADGGYRWRRTVVFSVEQIEVNAELADETFVLEFPIGASVAQPGGPAETIGGLFHPAETEAEVPPPLELEVAPNGLPAAD